MNDVLVHAGYSSFAVHPLQTVWIESHKAAMSPTSSLDDHPISSSRPDSSSATSHGGRDCDITLVLPEETLVLAAPNPEAKNEWFVNLQRCILHALAVGSSDSTSSRSCLTKMIKSYTPPIIRHTNFTFTKLPDLRGAEYEGAWLHGKLHGQGKLSWSDGRCYQGQLRQNQKHGVGRMEIADHCGNNAGGGKTVFDGVWKCDKFEGRGVISYSNGDVYKGMVKDGKAHGQGVFKQGQKSLRFFFCQFLFGNWNFLELFF